MKKITTLVIGIIMVITLTACGGHTNYTAHNGQYITFVNMFDTVNYLKFRNSQEKHTFDPDELYKINLKYENNTLWLWNTIGDVDIHRYDDVIYKDFDVIDEFNGLKFAEETIRVYYYKDSKIIILHTMFNMKLIEDIDLDINDRAGYDDINETLDEYEKKIKKYIKRD